MLCPMIPIEFPKKSSLLGMVCIFLWPKENHIMKGKLVAACTVVLSVAALNSTFPILFSEIIDTLGDHFDQKNKSIFVEAIFGLVIAYAATHWLSRCFGELRWLLFGRIEQPIRRQVNMIVFNHLHNLSLNFHLATRTGSISRIIDNGGRAIEDLLFNVIFLILPFLIEIFLVTNVMFLLFDGVFAVIMLCTLFSYLGALVIGSEWLRKHQRSAVQLSTSAHGKAIDSLINFETIKYTNSERLISENYENALSKVERMNIKALTWRSLTGLINVTVLGIGIVCIMLTATERVIEGAMTLGALVAVNQYLLQLIRPLDRLASLYRGIKKALVDLEEMRTLLNLEPEIIDKKDSSELSNGKGEITFNEVEFAYGNRQPTLKKISFTVPAGKTFGIVGPSGAGKSTIGRLLFRFYEVTSGCVQIDGNDIGKTTQTSLREAIAIVPQECVLFNESLKYNIGFAKPDSTDKEIVKAAKTAEIHKFISSLPDGYETLVGERGLKLSGGEKQRIALARAALKQPRIFIFDEATSSLDSQTESLIQKNLRSISFGKTTLIIAHRLSTVVGADEILYFEKGKILERGNHFELLALNGKYATMWNKQQKND